ncbi:UNVERIFIED_CONTAM: hypothetical protein BEN50_21860 [Euhalothece sp. KZN 001]
MNQHSHEFMEARRGGLGGSDMAAILGFSRYATPYDVWLAKRGEAEPERQEEKPWLYWGHQLEDLIAKEYQKRTQRRVQRVNRQMRHPDHSFMVGHIDRAVVNPEIAGRVNWKMGRLTTDRILEIKTANAFTAGAWGESGTDDVPEEYLIQCQWYMGLTGADVADLAVLIGGSDYRSYSIARHDGLIDDLVAEAERFWRLVESGVAPDPQTVEDCKRRWPQHTTSRTEIVGVDVARKVDRLKDIKAEIKELESEAEALRVPVLAAFGDAEAITHGGERLATWKTQAQTRLDAKKVKAERPDVFEQYAATTETRVLRLATRKPED